MGRDAVSTAIGNQVFLGVTDRLEVWKYESDGSLSGILRVQLRPEVPDAGMRDLWIEYSLRDEDDPETVRPQSASDGG